MEPGAQASGRSRHHSITSTRKLSAVGAELVKASHHQLNFLIFFAFATLSSPSHLLLVPADSGLHITSRCPRCPAKSRSAQTPFILGYRISLRSGKMTNEPATYSSMVLAPLSSPWARQQRGHIQRAQLYRLVAMVARQYEMRNAITDRLKLWLLGYEFPQTLFVITQEGITIVTTKKKGQWTGSDLHKCVADLMIHSLFLGEVKGRQDCHRSPRPW